MGEREGHSGTGKTTVMTKMGCKEGVVIGNEKKDNCKLSNSRMNLLRLSHQLISDPVYFLNK
jgi:ABC-type lipoprotein export system ATPase subunit